MKKLLLLLLIPFICLSQDKKHVYRCTTPYVVIDTIYYIALYDVGADEDSITLWTQELNKNKQPARLAKNWNVPKEFGVYMYIPLDTTVVNPYMRYHWNGVSLAEEVEP